VKNYNQLLPLVVEVMLVYDVMALCKCC